MTEVRDLWELGNHRLLCGDGTERCDLERVLNGSLSGMNFSDLPYNAAYSGKTARHLTMANDDFGDRFPAFLAAACQIMLAVNSGAIYLCMSSRELHHLCEAFLRRRGPLVHLRHLGQKRFHPGTCGLSAPVRADFVRLERRLSSLLVRRPRSGRCGAGPLCRSRLNLLAAERTGRRACVVEIDPRYCDATVRRWESYSGQPARLVPAGQSFSEVSAQRRRGEQTEQERRHEPARQTL